MKLLPTSLTLEVSFPVIAKITPEILRVFFE